MIDEILESFDLNKTSPLSKKVTPKEFYDIMIGLMDKTGWGEGDEELIRRGMKVDMPYITGHTFVDSGEKFFVYFLKRKEIEVHFVNLSENKFDVRTGSHGKTSQTVFATVVKTAVDFMKTSGYDSFRIKCEKSRVSLYKKILDVVMKRYLTNWVFVKEESNKDKVDFVYKKKNSLDEMVETYLSDNKGFL